jgi:hypothetical protein
VKALALGCLVASLSLAACGGGPVVGATEVHVPIDEAVRAHKAVVVSGHASRDEWRPEAQAMATRLVSKLERLGMFSAVYDEPGARGRRVDVEIEISVTDMVKVTASERQKLGDKAGQVRIAGTARLRAKANGAELGRASFTAAGYEGPRGGVTEDAADLVLDQIAALVSGRPDG